MLLLLITLLIRYFAPTYHLGFFCNDLSLRKPFKTETINPWTIIAGCVLFPPLLNWAIFLVTNYHTTDLPVKLFNLFTANYGFLFGMLINFVLEQVAKVSVGRLRPNFFESCQPVHSDDSSINCTTIQDTLVYVTDWKCSKVDDVHVQWSFYSGHCAQAAHAASFVCFLLWQRFAAKHHLRLIVAVLQVLVVTAALYVAYNR